MTDKTTVVTKLDTLIAPLYHLELVKDREISYSKSASTLEKAAQVLHELLDRSPTEQMVVLYLNSNSDIVGAERVGIGNVESVGATAPELFRGAIVHAAPEILLSHNHPSGLVKPSFPDMMFTLRMVEIGAFLGIRVRDHVIVGPNGQHVSMKEHMLHATRELTHELSTKGASGLKDKLLSALGLTPESIPSDLKIDIFDGGSMLPPLPKKKGDPNANAITDIRDSLSYWAINNLYT